MEYIDICDENNNPTEEIKEKTKENKKMVFGICLNYGGRDEIVKSVKEIGKLIKEEKSKELIDFKIMANGKISAGTYYYDFLPNGENDFIRYREGINSESKVLKDISIPVLVIFGDKDDCVLTEDIETIKGYLSKNISRCKIEIIKDADHSYSGKEKELGKVIIDNFKEE